MLLSESLVMQRCRKRLLRSLEKRGVSAALIAAMEAVPRHFFVPAEVRAQSYVDSALPIGREQTISQPSLVGHMLDSLALRTGMRVLDIGGGSGYVSALLAVLLGPQGQVFARERQGRIARITEQRLASMQQPDWAAIKFEHGDGAGGWPEVGPFDAIHVGAAFPTDESALAEQLAPGGRLIQPITIDGEQRLQLIERAADGSVHQQLDVPVCFVPVLPGLEHR